MALFDVVGIKEILLKERLDAFSFVSKNFLLARSIYKNKHNTIGELSLIHKVRNRDSRIYVKDKSKGLMYLSNTDISKSSYSDAPYMSKKFLSNIEIQKLKIGDLLTCAVGTIGTVCYVNKQLEGSVVSGNILRFTPKKYAGYIYAFLQSKYGQAVLKDFASGSVQEFITPPKLAKLPIPIFSLDRQQQVHDLIIKSNERRVDANKMLDEIINQLESKYIVSSKERYFSVNIKDILQGDKFTQESRIEADFYQPQAEKLIKEIKKQDWAFLGEISNEIQRSGLRERRFVKEGIPLITGQNLNLNKLDDLKMLSLKFTKNIEKNITKESDILISVQGTIGKIEYSYKNIYQGVFASEQLTKVSVKRELIHPGYIYAFLKSKLGQIQLQKYKTGSVIEWIIENNIASVVVPIPSDKGKAIGDLVDKLTLMRQEAYNYETAAIQLIETEIAQWQH